MVLPILLGIYQFFEFLQNNLYKIQYRVLLSRYRGKTLCPTCKGKRLKPETENVKIQGKSLGNLLMMPISELAFFLKNLKLHKYEAEIASRLLEEINQRIEYLKNIGLGYLTLNRSSSTLSGGESQRIHLATSLGSSLVGSLYILDEPSVGLHSNDTQKLINILKTLRDIGNTVVVVEHDEEIIKNADYIIDLGPGAGIHGGSIVYAGNQNDFSSSINSLTADYLFGKKSIPIPSRRRKSNLKITIKNAHLHNLKNIDVTFPLKVLTVVSGVSGSGKSTLVSEILFNAVQNILGNSSKKIGYDSIEGDLDVIEDVVLVDQNPIGKSTRSNAATYLKNL